MSKYEDFLNEELRSRAKAQRRSVGRLSKKAVAEAEEAARQRVAKSTPVRITRNPYAKMFFGRRCKRRGFSPRPRLY